MKREYTKPMVQMESFELDMHIAGPSSKTEEYYTLRETFEVMGYPDMDGVNGAWDGTDANKEVLEADFNAFLALSGYDNSTSGFCYHTNARPS